MPEPEEQQGPAEQEGPPEVTLYDQDGSAVTTAVPVEVVRLRALGYRDTPPEADEPLPLTTLGGGARFVGAVEEAAEPAAVAADEAAVADAAHHDTPSSEG